MGDTVGKAEGQPRVARGSSPGQPCVFATTVSWEHRSAFGGKSLFPGFLGDMQSQRRRRARCRSPLQPHVSAWAPRPSPLRDLFQPSMWLLTVQLLPLLPQKPTLDTMSHSRLHGWPYVGLVGVQNTLPGPATVQDGKKQEKCSHRPVSVPGPEDTSP